MCDCVSLILVSDVLFFVFWSFCLGNVFCVVSFLICLCLCFVWVSLICVFCFLVWSCEILFVLRFGEM